MDPTNTSRAGNFPLITLMKHYRAKPSAQLSKYLQDDINMQSSSLNWSNHKNVHCMRLHNERTICQLDNHVLISCHDLKLDIDESAKSHQALKPTQSKKITLF